MGGGGVMRGGWVGGGEWLGLLHGGCGDGSGPYGPIFVNLVKKQVHMDLSSFGILAYN